MSDLASLLPDLPPWQKRIAAHLLDGGDLRLNPAPDRTLKKMATGTAIRAELAARGHCHVISPDGRWCGRLTTVGPLWEQLPDLPSGMSASVVIYDEA